ncbi:MAG: [FeFe] hydrogenase H-cluster maturation GTPase HydF [Pirellulales bacterium]|nr:[FeFe] hydrogenase H-cluster maturation GTPase HydF [Pirellulales bacterium]
MKTTPKGLRLHIGIFGRRNAGKSSLLNAMTRQEVSIVSPVAGTTTDPVEKPMEMLPLGPVLWIDTAGIDDSGALGTLRVEKTRRIFDRTDVGILVVDAGCWSDFEEGMLRELRQRDVPVIVAFNKSDVAGPPAALREKLRLENVPFVETAASLGRGALEMRESLIGVVPEDFLSPPPLLSDLVPAGEMAVLVVPIDLEAPKGRLILPQVQAIRDLLDGDAYCAVVKEDKLPAALERLNRPPALVVTDSQAFREVAADTPPDVKMTSFSILMARQKGDLCQFVEGALAIDRLRVGDRVLVAEACTHHPVTDDIGRVKIPRWLKRRAGGELAFDTVQGHDFPDDLSGYRLVVHCGACMWNRREMLARMTRCRREGVPICNYGVTIAYTFGILERALAPFPDALKAFRAASMSGMAEAAP